MKKSFLSAIILLFCMQVFAQTNLTGAYGYTLPPQGDVGNDKQATGPSGSIVLLKIEGNKYRFWLDVTVGWPSYNSGETDGTVYFVNDTASFDNTHVDAINSCILNFRITNNILHIASKADAYNCGFGNGVHADGDYTKLKDQPVLNYAWLKTQYEQSPYIIITSKKAQAYSDENSLHPFSQPVYFVKGEKLLSIAETEKTIYTEIITPQGKFIYGWIKKSDLKMADSD